MCVIGGELFIFGTLDCMQGYCDFFPEEELVCAVEVGHVILFPTLVSPYCSLAVAIIGGDVSLWGEAVDMSEETDWVVNRILGFRVP